MKKLSKKLILAAGALALVALLAVGLSSQSVTAANDVVADNSDATYVGKEVCYKCHADKVKEFNMTNHATAFRPLSDFSLDKAYTATIYDNADASKSYTLQFNDKNVLGVMCDHYIIAAVPGFTNKYYRVGVLEKNPNGTYRIEPYSTSDYNKDGVLDWGTTSYTCGNCHSPGANANLKATDPVPVDVGISCESCHGPGSKHVAAAEKKGSYPKVGPQSCYTCHPVDTGSGLGSRNAETGVITAQTHYGTRGFYATKHYTSLKLNSCLTCHDPHAANKEGKMLAVNNKSDTAVELCNTCHEGHFNETNLAQAFWVNPVDQRSHYTKDHSMFKIRQSDYIITETSMQLGPKAVNQLKTLYPSFFK